MSTEKNTEFKERFDAFMKTAKKATKKAANKTMELADIASLNLRLQSLNVKLSEKFEYLGKLSYKKLSGIGEISDENEPADTTVDEIAETVEAIDRLYDEISRLKTEIKIKKEMQKANKD
jgi:uncharacterized small protein (DUF1192 family)